jgi:uncharacterized membrane protein
MRGRVNRAFHGRFSLTIGGGWETQKYAGGGWSFFLVPLFFARIREVVGVHIFTFFFLNKVLGAIKGNSWSCSNPP